MSSKFFIIIVIFLLIVLISVVMHKTIDKGDNYHTYTKAIYNGTYVQNFLIECNGNRLLRMTGLTGYVPTENVSLPIGLENPCP